MEKALIIYGYIAPIAAVPKRIINVTRPCWKSLGDLFPINVKIYARQGLILTGRHVITLKVIAILAIFISQSDFPGITGRLIISSGVKSVNEK